MAKAQFAWCVDHTPSDEGPEPERFSTPETPKTGNPKAGLVLTMKAGQEAGSGDEQLTPTADEQPMVLWESKDLPGLDANGLGNLTDKEEKAADSTVELEQVNISLKPEEPKRSPSPVTQKVMDDDTLTRRKGKNEGEAGVDSKKEDGERDVEAVKEADGEAAKQGTVTVEQTVTPQAPSTIKELTSEPKPANAARRVSPASSKSSSVDAKKPPPRAAGGVAGGRPPRPKSMADAKEMSPVRPAVPAKPVISGKRASQLKMSSVSPESSKESSPVRQTGQPKEMSPNSSGGVAAKKDAVAGRGVTAKPKSTTAPGKSPARQPVATPSPRGRAAAKTGDTARSDVSPSQVSAAKPKSGGSPSRGQVSKPTTSASPSRSPHMKRKTDLPPSKVAASRLSQGGGLTVERPITRARSDETNNSSQSKEKESTDGGAEAKLDSSAAKTDKGDGEVAKKKSDAVPKGSVEVQKKRRRRISSASTGSEEGRRSRPSSRSSVDDGEELKEAMKRRSLPRQQVDFTVKRQEMNMMHGYKKMLVVKQSLEQLLGVTVGEDFLGSLEDGIVLCQLMNKLHPGTIAHFHTPTDDQPLSVPKKVRNVEAFIRGCKQIEIEHICTASDIMDAKDPMKILKCVDDLLSSM